MTYNLNKIISITTSMLNIKILYLFRPGLNIFKTQKFNIGFLIRIPGILIKLATR